MLRLLIVFTEVMLPILVITGLGAWVGKRAGISTRSLSRLVFEMFTPALVFHNLINTNVSGALAAQIVTVVVAGFVGVALLSFALTSALRWPKPEIAGVTLSAAAGNMGNIGLPVAALAFGAEGLDVAVVAVVATISTTNSGGIVIASLAGGSVRRALVEPFRVPVFWAALAGLGVVASGNEPPLWIQSTAETLAGAAIPAMLVVLGLQIGARLPKMADLPEVVGTIGLRLLGGPLVVAGATMLVGLGGVAQRTLIVLGGMPTAVAVTVIAARYNAAPGLVSRIVVLSTFASFVTLTVLIALLR